MRRYWHDIPTAMISFGYPYHLYDAPRVPTYINAYCTIDEMQAAADAQGRAGGDGRESSLSRCSPYVPAADRIVQADG